MTKRRGHGEGSISQRKDGRWEARIDLGWKNGKRHRRSIYGKTRKEVSQKLTKALNKKQGGDVVATGERLTVERYLNEWLDSIEQSLAPKTYRSYTDTARLHINPDLGRERLNRLRAEHVDRLMRAKVESGLSPRSVNYIRSVLRIALNRAIRRGLLVRNAAALSDPIREHHKEVSVWTVEQTRKFLEAARGDRLEAMYTAGLSLGLRLGEVTGLAWDCLDLDKGTLEVRHALQRINGKLTLKEPKTERSKRTIALPEICIRALRKHRLRQFEEQLAFEGVWDNELNLVFVTRHGTPLDPSNARKQFQRVVRDTGLPPTRFHDLRHLSASLLAAQGVGGRVVMEILGHSQIATTMDLYSHLFEEVKRDAASMIDRAVGLP